MSENARENAPSEGREELETPRVPGADPPPDAVPVTSGGDGSGDAGQKLCTFCGKSNFSKADSCRSCGRFLPRNRVNGANQARRILRAPGTLPPDLRVSVEEFREAVISDQGGVGELTAIRGGLVRLLVDAEAGKRLLMNEVVAKGIGSKPGRAAYDRLLATMDKWTRVASMLGLDRRQKQVDLARVLSGMDRMERS